jgi:NAD(P)-dependent dehydrogenase (short-subunit alcohol dehydrogenase family)
VGRGVAAALAAEGYRVFATGRSIAAADLPAAVERVPCDHTRDADTEAAFRRVEEAGEGLDILVNSAWGGYERMVEDGQFTWGAPFWKQAPHRWSGMMDAGVRAAFFASAQAARIMIPRKRGLIVNISFWAAQRHLGNAVYGISKAATDKMTSDMAHELREYGVSVISLYPGLVRTESVLEAAKAGWLDLTNSESPEFSGRVVAALYRDAGTFAKSGKVVVAAEAALELGVADTDGRQPTPHTLETLGA